MVLNLADALALVEHFLDEGSAPLRL